VSDVQGNIGVVLAAQKAFDSVERTGLRKSYRRRQGRPPRQPPPLSTVSRASVPEAKKKRAAMRPVLLSLWVLSTFPDLVLFDQRICGVIMN
jgi:hypothetical protein